MFHCTAITIYIIPNTRVSGCVDYYTIIDVYFSVRSTPVEALHSILLGPYKYLLKSTLPKLSPREKVELLARIRAFNFSVFRVKLVGNVVRYHQSFEGRDYKAWAQMAPFVLFPYLAEERRKL